MPERRLLFHSPTGLPSTRIHSLKPVVEFYPERAVMMAGPGDIVCVPKPLDQEHLTWLNELGIGPRPDDVLTVAGAPEGAASLTLAERGARDGALLRRISARVGTASLELLPYAVSAEMAAFARALEGAGVSRVRLTGDPAASARADAKHAMRDRAMALGVPVAPGEVVELQIAGGRRRGDFEPLRAAIQRQSCRSDQVLVRGSSGSGGSSTYIVGRTGDDAEGVIRRVAALGDNRVYLVETLVDATVSPNLHLQLEPDGTVSALVATDQRWGRPLVHSGNVLPSSARCLGAMERWARLLAASLHAEGFAGPLGIDFVECREPGTGRPRAFLAEVNPRINGADYPLALHARLNQARWEAASRPVPAFASGFIETGAGCFGQLRELLGDLLFSHERGAGVVPYMLGALSLGTCAVVALGESREEALAFHAEAQAAMEGSWAGR